MTYTHIHPRSPAAARARSALSIAILACLFISGAALGQSEPQAQTESQDDSATREDSQVVELEPVIVSGQKVKRTIKETSSSVEVISKDKIERNADRTTIGEVLGGTQNIIYSNSTDAPIIRGIDTKGPVSFGNAYLAKPVPGATISVDGRYLTSGELGTGAAGLWDVDAVEVYRGPQTSSQGANSIAGAVVINTKDPTFKPEYGGQLLFGSRNKRRYSVMLSGPISQDFAVRFAADYRSRDTFVKYTSPKFTAGDFDLGWEDVNARAKILWEPESIAGLSAKLTYSIMSSKRPRYEAVSEPYKKLESLSFFQDNQTHENNATIFDLSYDFGDNLVLSNQAQYSTGTYDYKFSPPFTGTAERDNRNVSNELRINFGSDDSQVSGFGGLFFWLDKTTNKLNNVFGSADADLSHESLAAYGELNWRFDPQWTLGTSLRYQVDNIGHDGIASYVPDVRYKYAKRFQSLLPKLSLAYDIDSTATVGVLVNKGYIPGGTGLNFRAGAYYEFNAEYAWNYELFSRFTFLNKSLVINSNAFYTVFEDSQRAVTNFLDGKPFGTIIVNADEAISYGLETSADYRVGQSTHIYGGVGVLRTEISKFKDYRGEEFVGKEFGKAPGYMFNVGFNQQIAEAVTIGGDMRYTDKYFSDDVNDPALRVGSYTVASINTSYHVNKNVELFGYVRNLFDSHAPMGKFQDFGSGGTSAYLLEPQEVGIGVKARF